MLLEGQFHSVQLHKMLMSLPLQCYLVLRELQDNEEIIHAYVI